MYTERQLSLCVRIREHCWARGWYGADGDNPSRYRDSYRSCYSPDGENVVEDERWDDIRSLRFAFPPATDEQLAATEKALGFPLPLMLRALYSEVANGGFGPGNGITGTRGGYCFGDDGRTHTVDQCPDADASIRYFNLAEYEALQGAPRHLLLPPHTWPAHFIPLTYWGCSTDSYVDAHSGCIYYAGVWAVVTTASGVESHMHVFRQEDSLEDWLDSSLHHKGEARQSAPRRWFEFKTIAPALYTPTGVNGEE